MELLTILPNLSIGVISVLALAYLSIKFSQNQSCTHQKFIDALDSKSIQHAEAMQEREIALREVEKHIREELVNALSKSTSVISENSKVMSRVVNHLDK